MSERALDSQRKPRKSRMTKGRPSLLPHSDDQDKGPLMMDPVIHKLVVVFLAAVDVVAFYGLWILIFSFAAEVSRIYSSWIRGIYQ
jgi:hypothetical protein